LTPRLEASARETIALVRTTRSALRVIRSRPKSGIDFIIDVDCVFERES
jgi:hypothetical protein